MKDHGEKFEIQHALCANNPTHPELQYRPDGTCPVRSALCELRSEGGEECRSLHVLSLHCRFQVESNLQQMIVITN